MKISTQVEMLERENEQLRRARDGKLALFIRLDGSTQIKQPMAGPDGYPLKRYRQEVLRAGRWVECSAHWNEWIPGSPYREEFLLIAETQPYYVYEQIN